MDGSFEVVPGVTADEYIKRFSTIEVSNPTDRRNFRIRVPPAPETFYDIGKDAQGNLSVVGIYSSIEKYIFRLQGWAYSILIFFAHYELH